METLADPKGRAPCLCAHCFERGQRSYLQPPPRREFHHDVFSCNACGYTANIPNDLEPVILTTGNRRNWDDFT